MAFNGPHVWLNTDGSGWMLGDDATGPLRDYHSFGDSTKDFPFTASAIFRIRASGGSTKPILTKAIASNQCEWVLYFNPSTSKVHFWLYDLTNSNRIGVIGTKTIVIGEWYHALGTYDGSGVKEGLSLWVDGASDFGSYTTSGTYVAMHNTNSRVEMGKWFNFAPGSSDIGNGTIWGRMLNDNEIKQIANDPLAPFVLKNRPKIIRVQESVGDMVPAYRMQSRITTKLHVRR